MQIKLDFLQTLLMDSVYNNVISYYNEFSDSPNHDQRITPKITVQINEKHLIVIHRSGYDSKVYFNANQNIFQLTKVKRNDIVKIEHEVDSTEEMIFQNSLVDPIPLTDDDYRIIKAVVKRYLG